MAYCKKCGAYIPDGLSACLACGFDESAPAGSAEKKESDTSASYGFSNDELRQKLEQQRAEQRERSRQWAQQEQERRRRQQESQKWAEEEFARRQAEKERQAQNYVNRSTTARTDGAQTGEGNKALAALSYLSILFILPSIFTPSDRFARFHARQGLKLFVFGILADLLGAITGFGWVVSLLRFYMIYKGMSNALNGKSEPLPWIGNIGEK